MGFREKLEAGTFAFTAEVGPLKGTDTTEIEEVAEALKGKVDAVNVTDQQSSVMRLGSLATCHLVQDHGMEACFQITCRDRNRLALQSDLLSAWVLGVKSVLALTGDLPLLGDHPAAKRVYLRLMSLDGGTPKVLAYLYGGQGTMNVPSWSPDSKQLAFVSNTVPYQ